MSGHVSQSAHLCPTVPPPSDALEGKGPERLPQRRLKRRLEEVAKAVGGGYCRLQMSLKPALGVRGTVAGHRLDALEGGGGVPPPFPMHPPPPVCPRVSPSSRCQKELMFVTRLGTFLGTDRNTTVLTGMKFADQCVNGTCAHDVAAGSLLRRAVHACLHDPLYHRTAVGDYVPRALPRSRSCAPPLPPGGLEGRRAFGCFGEGRVRERNIPVFFLPLRPASIDWGQEPGN